MAFGKLRGLARRGSSGRGSEDRPAVGPADDLASEDAAVGPPMLLPAAIYRRMLYDAIEFTPAWLARRPALVTGPSTEASAPARPTRSRRSKAKAATPGAAAGGSTTRRKSRKPPAEG
jgi:hypothetical protein